MGSPPHTRGIQIFTVGYVFQIGFTPAYAGNTHATTAIIIYWRVHPRIRGEYRNLTAVVYITGGSPPHTRGIQVRDKRARGVEGFTPAYAGNTRHSSGYIRGRGVHPRIRGEYCQVNGFHMVQQGSPPHTRGILQHTIGKPRAPRFTPAYAGNTFRRGGLCRGSWVHPRIRGEYYRTSTHGGGQAGSPPHTRGILCCDEFIRHNGGFTPAHAVNTFLR